MNEGKLKKYIMALLFHQTCSLQNDYNSEKVSEQPIKCFLVNKSSLDRFKKKNNFNDAVEYFNICQVNNKLTYDFDKFKNNLYKHLDSSTKKLYNNYKQNNLIFNEIGIIDIENNNNKITEKMCLIKEEFLNEFINDTNMIYLPYHVYLGNKIIIIKLNNIFGYYICEFEENNKNLDSNIIITDCQQFYSEEDATKHFNEIIIKKNGLTDDNNSNSNLSKDDNDNNKKINEINNEENKRMTNVVINNNRNQSTSIENFNEYICPKNVNNNINNNMNNINNNMNNGFNINQNMNMRDFMNNSNNEILSYGINYGLNISTNNLGNNNMCNSSNDIYNNIQRNMMNPNMNQNNRMFQNIPPNNNINMNMNQNNNFSQFQKDNMNNLNIMTQNNIINQTFQNNFVMQNNNINNPNFMKNETNMNPTFINGNPIFTNQNNNMNHNNFSQFPNNNMNGGVFVFNNNGKFNNA